MTWWQGGGGLDTPQKWWRHLWKAPYSYQQLFLLNTIIFIIIWFSLFEDKPSHVVVVLIKDVDVAGVSETFHDDEEDRQEKDGNDNEQDEEYYVDNDENDEDHKD